MVDLLILAMALRCTVARVSYVPFLDYMIWTLIYSGCSAEVGRLLRLSLWGRSLFTELGLEYC
jgi:hypothetical protein